MAIVKKCLMSETIIARHLSLMSEKVLLQICSLVFSLYVVWFTHLEW